MFVAHIVTNNTLALSHHFRLQRRRNMVAFIAKWAVKWTYLNLPYLMTSSYGSNCFRAASPYWYSQLDWSFPFLKAEIILFFFFKVEIILIGRAIKTTSISLKIENKQEDKNPDYKTEWKDTWMPMFSVTPEKVR